MLGVFNVHVWNTKQIYWNTLNRYELLTTHNHTRTISRSIICCSHCNPCFFNVLISWPLAMTFHSQHYFNTLAFAECDIALLEALEVIFVAAVFLTRLKVWRQRKIPLLSVWMQGFSLLHCMCNGFHATSQSNDRWKCQAGEGGKNRTGNLP